MKKYSFNTKFYRHPAFYISLIYIITTFKTLIEKPRPVIILLSIILLGLCIYEGFVIKEKK